MECKNTKCSNEVESKGNKVKEFCSDRCRMQFNRSKANSQSEQPQSEQPKANTGDDTITPATYGIDKHAAMLDPDLPKVYGRTAAIYFPDKFESRPEPLDMTDTPNPLNRGRYTRLDGTEYQLDCTGRVFELTNGKVYQTVADVREANARRTSSTSSQTQAEVS